MIVYPFKTISEITSITLSSSLGGNKAVDRITSNAEQM